MASSKCFLTTAACQALGRGDDCPELNLLRWFRDTVLCRMPGGAEAIALYYRVAPVIVTRIESSPGSPAAFRGIYERGIVPALAAIRDRRYGDAYRTYRRLVSGLMRSCGLPPAEALPLPTGPSSCATSA